MSETIGRDSVHVPVDPTPSANSLHRQTQSRRRTRTSGAAIISGGRRSDRLGLEMTRCLAVAPAASLLLLTGPAAGVEGRRKAVARFKRARRSRHRRIILLLAFEGNRATDDWARGLC